MAYDDRDYFRPQTRFDFGGPMGPATKGLLIAFASAYLVALFWANAISMVDAEFWANVAAGEAQQVWAFRVLVLTAGDVAPWAEGFAPGYWKLLTGWIVPTSIISAALNCLFIYMLGRRTESVFGSMHFLLIFALSCVFAAVMAALIDPLVMPNRERIVIMGPIAGILMLLTTLIWLAPGQRSVFGWPLRNVVIGVLVVIAVISFLMPVLSSSAIALSPTQAVWGPVFAWGYMSYLKSKDAVPTLALASSSEPWSQPGPSFPDKPDKSELKRKQALEKLREQERDEQERLDAILEKVGKEGLNSLTRAERKFLDQQSSKRREKQP